MLQHRHHDQGGGQLVSAKYPNALRTTHHESSKLTDQLVKLQRNDQQLLEPGGTRQLLSPRRTREKAEEAEAATGSIQSQRWQQIRQDTKQNMEQPLQSAYELTDHHERTSIQQEGISGIPVIHRLKSSTHLNNFNSLKNSNMQAQGP